MKQSTVRADSSPRPHIAGVPDRHGLGSSKKEALALVAGIFVLVVIAISFWYTSTH